MHTASQNADVARPIPDERELERARRAMADYGSRVRIHRGDLAEPLRDTVGGNPVDLVGSGYAIHHLADSGKRFLYAEIFALLAPGGVPRAAGPRGQNPRAGGDAARMAPGDRL